MAICEFWDKKKCQSYGTYREDMKRYLCEDHYQWHLKSLQRLDKIVDIISRKSKEEGSK